LHCFTKGHDALQVTAIHILADILTTHPGLLSAQDADANLQKQILKVFSKGMKADHTPDVQSVATIAVCKLMLTSVIQDVDLFKQVVVCYFDPATKENAGVRQALSYFLPVYCHSQRENMERMADVAGAVVHALIDMGEELDEGEEMVGINTVGNMLVDWTDARKLVVPDHALVSWDEAGRKEVKAVNSDIHLDLAESLLEQAMNHGCSSKPISRVETPKMLISSTEEDKKAVIAMLGKLYITANSNSEKLRITTDLVIEAIDNKIASDAPSRNALNKLHLALSKAMGEAGKTKKIAENILAPADEEGPTTVEEQGAEESVLAKEEDLPIETVEGEGFTEAQDSLLEELFTDEEEL